MNHRTSRISKGETTKYAYGRNGALAYQEKTKDGSVTKRSFTYLNNEIIGFTDSENNEETAYYTVTDIQGSITEVYDGSSNLVWKSGYTAFGELAGEVVDLIDFDGMYTGCDYDAETRLTYHWNRWRSEDGSSFISEDPARDGANWYGYAGQNPMVYVDRIGLAPSNDYLGPSVAGPQPKPQNQENGFVPLVQNPSGMPQNQTPNITGPSNVQTSLPPVPDVKTDGRNLNEKIIETERKSKTVLDWIQTALDVLGVIPVFGEAADGINGLISLGRGDELGAALSFASMIPVVGDAVGKGGKATRFIVKNGDEIAGAVKEVIKSTDNIPSNVTDALSYIKKGDCVPGANGGKTFKNRGGINPKTGNINQELPKVDSSGKAITYAEWDVNAKLPGASRDAERIVTGSDGSIWWTKDHYETFTRLE